MSTFTRVFASTPTKTTHVKIQHRNINVIQKLRMILDRIAARKENNNLLLQILFQERE